MKNYCVNHPQKTGFDVFVIPVKSITARIALPLARNTISAK